ncbi:MAG: vWA domain-containing protein, partial [Thermoguttaceae bacterium]
MYGSVDRNSRSGYRLLEQWSIGWLVSSIVNLALLVAAAIWLLPLAPEAASFSLTARVDTEEGQLDVLSEAADLAALDFGADPELSQPDSTPAPKISLDLSLAGGTLGDGPGGWQGGAGSGGSGDGTAYFGTVAYGNRFVYVLDKSGSMTRGADKQSGSGSRLDRARYELLRSIEKLAPYQQFYVILFSDVTDRMFGDESPKPATIPATPQNKQRLREWIAQVEVGGSTDPREALFLALSIAPDAVFLLSDGDFNPVTEHPCPLFEDNPEAEVLINRVNHSGIPIHTFAYEDPSSRERMEVVAQLTGGTYK